MPDSSSDALTKKTLFSLSVLMLTPSLSLGSFGEPAAVAVNRCFRVIRIGDILVSGAGQ